MFVLPPKVMGLVLSLVNSVSPGKSMYSRVEIPYCNEICQESPLCDNLHDWRCKRPIFEKWLYNQNLSNMIEEQKNTKQWNSYEDLEREARFQSYTRPETYEEAVERYVIIAKAIYDASRELSIMSADQQLIQFCKNEAKLKNNPTECQKLKLNRPWRWSPDHLMWMMATVAKYESGFRRDVHSGKGNAALGDCEWKYNKDHPRAGQRAPAGSKGSYRVPGTCRSACLSQINLGTGRTSNGWSIDDLVGIDYDSTKRCFITAGRYLATHRLRCTRSAQVTDWVMATFTGYGTGWACRINQAWPTHRFRTFQAFVSRPGPQNSKVQSHLDTLLYQNNQNPIQIQLVKFSLEYQSSINSK